MVWNTPQSATYQTERYFDKCAKPCETCAEEQAKACEEYHGCSKNRAESCAEPCADKRRPSSPKTVSKGLFDDSDMLLVFGVLIILMREKADQKLLFALLIAMLM